MMEMPQTADPYECIRLENQLCFPLYACAKEVTRQYRKPLEELNLTYTQYIVMLVFWEFGGMTEGELGRKVHLDSGTLAPLLKRLEKQGLIHRERPDTNERKLFLSLILSITVGSFPSRRVTPMPQLSVDGSHSIAVV